MNNHVRMRLVPSVFQIGMHAFNWRLSANLLHLDSALYDHTAAMLLRPADLFIGWATASLASGRKAKQRGARFVLDRACPHVDFQQRIVGAEAEKTGAKWEREPDWFHERQIAEYEEADAVLAPSEYTRRTFPEHLRSKIVKAPLLGRCSFPADVSYKRNDVFTVGAVGGQPLRKGYLYLLQAWKKLALPNARLIVRSDFTGFPVLQELAASQPLVQVVPYVADIADFYRQCDVFVLPSVDDGFGMALYEAMAYGVPSIATNNCGSSELLAAGRECIVIEPMDVQQLAGAILDFYDAEEFRYQVARAGRDAIRTLMVGESSPLYLESIGQLLQMQSINLVHAVAAVT